MQIKTRELTGAALDWAVAKAEGKKPSIERGLVWVRGKSSPFVLYQPSSDWAQGGPILDRERINLRDDGGDQWAADDSIRAATYGLTPLVAAMRCYVASKLGETVNVPEELT